MRSMGLRGDHAIFGVLAGDGHEHGVAAAVDADFDGVDVEFGEQFLEIFQRFRGEGFAIGFFEKRGALGFAQRRVEGEDVVFRLVAGIVADGPVGDDEVGEGFSRGTSCRSPCGRWACRKSC